MIKLLHINSRNIGKRKYESIADELPKTKLSRIRKTSKRYDKSKIFSKYTYENILENDVDFSNEYTLIETRLKYILLNREKYQEISHIAYDLKEIYNILIIIYGYLIENTQDNDLRNGKDTYDYGSISSILDNISYISDRFYCSFRIRWLINLINPNYYPYSFYYKSEIELLKNIRN